KDTQILNKTEFHDFEESDNFPDYDSNAISNVNNNYQDDIEDTEIPSPSSLLFQSLPPPLPSLILTDILPLSILTGISHPLTSIKTSPLIPIKDQSKPICESNSTTLLSSCILVDLVDGKLQTCGKTENIKNIC
ncbi:13530_t:CDS:2, partial [Funneliformis geosporum]